MAFLSGTVAGTGTLHTVDAADPFVFLLVDAVYLEQSANFYGIYVPVANATLMIAGTIASVGGAIGVGDAANVNLTVTDTGRVYGRNFAIDFLGASANARITNEGHITADLNAIRVLNDTSLTLVNTGTIATSDISAIQLSGGGDTIRNTGTIVGDVLLGAGSDIIDNRGGSITGTLYGGAGNDTYYVNGDERIVESYIPGDVDTVYATRDYALSSWVENLYLIGQATRGVGNSVDNLIRGNNLGGTLIGAGGDDILYAGAGDSVVNGNSGGDSLYGGEGDDVVSGGAGDDFVIDYGGLNTLRGNAGDDTFDPGTDDDAIDGGMGSDTVTYYFASGPVTANLAAGVATGDGVGTDTLTSIEKLVGSSYADLFTGNVAANRLSGGEGDDQLVGSGGDDVLVGGVGADRLDGGNGIDTASYDGDQAGARVNLATAVISGSAQGDTLISIENLTGSAFNDIFVGSDGANRLDGGAGNDQLTGGAGEDVLVGGTGNDQLTGGSEKDVFLFTSLPAGESAFGADTIKDFQNGTDVISFVGNPFVHDMSDLLISKAGSALVIDIAGFGSVKVLNFAPSELDLTDFLFG